MADSPTGTYLDYLSDQDRPPLPPAWEQVAPHFQEKYPDLDQEQLRGQYEQARSQHIQGIAQQGHLEGARKEMEGKEETGVSYMRRKKLPFFSPILSMNQAREYHAASQRLAAGEPLPHDYRTIAGYEKTQQEDEQRHGSLGSHLADVATSLPAMATEALAGGSLLKGAGVIGSQAAAGTAAATARVAIPRFIGGAMAQTALMPAIYMESWSRNNLAAHRDPLHPAGLPAAFAMGTLQTAVLGSLGPVGSRLTPELLSKSIVGRLGIKTGVGLVEQQVADAVGGALGWHAGYGTLGELLDGKFGEAGRNAAGQALTFAVFGALHDQGDPAARRQQAMRAGLSQFASDVEIHHQQQRQQRGQQLLQGAADHLLDMQQRGLGADSGGKRLADLGDALGMFLDDNANPTREQVRRFFSGLTKDGTPAHSYAMKIAETFPAEAERAAQRERLNRPLAAGEELPPSTMNETAAEVGKSRRELDNEVRKLMGLPPLPEAEAGNPPGGLPGAQAEGQVPRQGATGAVGGLPQPPAQPLARGQPGGLPGQSPPEPAWRQSAAPVPGGLPSPRPERPGGEGPEPLGPEPPGPGPRSPLGPPRPGEPPAFQGGPAAKPQEKPAEPQVSHGDSPAPGKKPLTPEEQALTHGELQARAAELLGEPDLAEVPPHILDSLEKHGADLEPEHTAALKAVLQSGSLRGAEPITGVSYETVRKRAGKALAELKQRDPENWDRVELTKEGLGQLRQERANADSERVAADKESGDKKHAAARAAAQVTPARRAGRGRDERLDAAIDSGALHAIDRDVKGEDYGALSEHLDELTPAELYEKLADEQFNKQIEEEYNRAREKAVRLGHGAASVEEGVRAGEAKAEAAAAAAAAPAAGAEPAKPRQSWKDFVKSRKQAQPGPAGPAGLTTHFQPEGITREQADALRQSLGSASVEQAASTPEQVRGRDVQIQQALGAWQDVQPSSPEDQGPGRSAHSAVSPDVRSMLEAELDNDVYPQNRQGEKQQLQGPGWYQDGMGDWRLLDPSQQDVQATVWKEGRNWVADWAAEERMESTSGASAGETAAEVEDYIADQTGHRAVQQAQLAEAMARRLPELQEAANARVAAKGAPMTEELARRGAARNAVVKGLTDFLAGEEGHLDLDRVGEVARNVWERIKSATRHARDSLAELAGQMGPRTTRLDRETGEALARHNAVPVLVKEAVPDMIDRVLGDKPTPEADRRLGAAATEMHLRQTRQGWQQKAQQLRQQGDAEGARQAQWHADHVVSEIGPGKDIADEAAYQQIVASPEFQQMRANWHHLALVMEANYRKALGLEDSDDIHSFTQVPDFPMNLKPRAEGEGQAAEAQPPAGTGQGNLKGTHQGTLLFARERKGNAPGGYDTSLSAIIENSLRHGFTRAAKAELFRVAQANGVGMFGAPGQRLKMGDDELTEIPHVFPKKDTQFVPGEEGGQSFYVKSAAYPEWRAAFKVDQPVSSKSYKTFAAALTRASLASTVEFAYHSKNLLTMLTKPGMRLSEFLEDTIGVVRGDKEVRARLVELARTARLKGEGMESGLLLPEKYKRYDPTYWAGAGLDVLQRGMRLAADRAFTRLAEKGLVEDTETNRRDFTNQLGQYLPQAQHQVVRLFRDTGVGPFATAGSNYWMQGLKTLALGHGLQATSLKADLALRAGVGARILGTVGAVLAANYALHQRVDGDDKTPLGAIKLASRDGKSVYFDLTNLTGLTRGMRQTGMLALLEGQRRDQASGGKIDRAVESVIHGLVHPGVGPSAAFLWTAATGRNTLGRQVADKPDVGGSQAAQNALAAVRSANPTVATLGGWDNPNRKEEPSTLATAGRLLGPFGLRESSALAPATRTYYERMRDLEEHRRDSPEFRAGKRFPHEQEYQRLHAYKAQLDDIAMRLRGEYKQDGRTRQGPKPSEETAQKLRQIQESLANKALAK